MFLLHVDQEERCKQKREFISIYITLNISMFEHLKVTDIFITLNETAAENWSFGQGVAQLVKRKGEQNDE